MEKCILGGMGRNNLGQLGDGTTDITEIDRDLGDEANKLVLR